MSAALTQGHIEGRLEGLALSFETEGEVALRVRADPGHTVAYWRVAQQMRRIRRPYMAIGLAGAAEDFEAAARTPGYGVDPGTHAEACIRAAQHLRRLVRCIEAAEAADDRILGEAAS